MIFRTLNGDLTVFNKTLISTKDHLKALETVNATVYNKNGAFNLQGLLVNSSQSVSTFTKLNNAFKAYNGNLSKSTQLQNAYVQAVGKQNTSLGNYLAGLNGAKASMGGYIKSLVAAKAASIGLQVASVALNTAISMGITLAISALISQISKWIHVQEEARQKAIELTNAYKEQKKSLDSQIEKYKELKETLDKGNLSTDETRSIKEQLLEIQKSLIESYGDEASNIDLVNGKYREQLGLLSELSKEKATDYVIENRDVFADAKKALEKIRTYNIGTVTSWSSYAPKTEDQQALLDFIDSYSELFKITADGSSSYGAQTFDVRNLVIKADVESADVIMHQFAEDLEKYGKDNNIDVSDLLEGISGQLKKTWTDELKEYKTIYDEFMKAEVVRNDTLRPLYQQSIQAVEEYNKALSSGKGVAEAKANLDSVKQTVQNVTSELEGSQEIFNGIYDGINKSAESAYNLGQAFENDESVKGYAEQLKGLTDIDLQAIIFEDNVKSPGEEAFKALIDILGLSENEVQNLIDKLVELGYVQGKVQSSTLNNKNHIPSLSINETVDQLNTRLKPTFDTLKSAYQDIFTSDGFDLDAVDIPMLEDIRSAIEKLNEAEDLDFNIDMGAFDDFAKVLTYANTTEKEAQQAFDDLATSLFYAADSTAGMTDETKDLVTQLLESLGVVNATEVAEYALMEAKAQSVLVSHDLANATAEEYAEILEEGVAAGITRKEIYALAAAEIAFGNNDLSVEQKISKLKDLAKQYGDTASVALATAIANDLASGHTDVDSAINDLMAKINSGVKQVDIDFLGAGTPSKKSSSKSSSEKDATKEFDWIEQAIENVEKEVKNLDDIVNSAYSTFSQKNEALAQEIGKVSEEIQLQQQAYDEYMRKADSIGLPDHYKELVQNSTIGIEEITDENLQDQIDAYQKWYDKAQNAADAIKELKTDMKDLYVSAYELQTDNLKDRLDSDSITQKQYLEGLKAAYEQFYANLEDFAQQYHEAVLEYLDEEKSYLNDVAGAAASLLDREIDTVRDDADEQENRLKRQIDLLEDRKKPLEDELKALEDKAKKENLIYNLQKAQYDLARAEYQRPKLVNYMPDTIVI